MLFGQKPVFVGLHFAKTGGTSIRAHAAASLRKDEFLPYGIYASANNFFTGKPLLAEMSARQKARLRFVYGHGAGADILHHFAGRQVSLFVVCRDPFRRFVSSLKHTVRTERQFGGEVSPRAVFESQPANPFASNILKHFRHFAPEGVNDPKERLVAILRSFRFVMSTDNLNAQTQPFFAALGVPPMTEARRVYREDVDLGDLTEEEVRARDDLDGFVNEAVNAHFVQVGPDAAKAVNPFGFDKAALRERLATLAAAAPPAGTEIEAEYFSLFGFLDRHGRLEAAKVLIEAGGQSAAVAAIFGRFCREVGRRFDDSDLTSRSLCHQAEVYLRLGQHAEAADCARRAVAADPDNPMALFLAGRVALDERRYADGAANLERAVALNPTHAPSFRHLATAYRHLGRDADADAALKAAERI